MYFIRACLPDELQDRESSGLHGAARRSEARLYDPEEALLIPARAAASSAGQHTTRDLQGSLWTATQSGAGRPRPGRAPRRL